MDKQSKQIEDFIEKASRQVSFNDEQMKEIEKGFSSNEGLGRLNLSEEQMKEIKNNLNLDALEQISEEVNSEARNDGVFKDFTIPEGFSLKDYHIDEDILKSVKSMEGTFKNIPKGTNITLPDIFNVDKIKNASFTDLFKGDGYDEEEADVRLDNNEESSMDDDFEYDEEEL